MGQRLCFYVHAKKYVFPHTHNMQIIVLINEQNRGPVKGWRAAE